MKYFLLTILATFLIGCGGGSSSDGGSSTSTTTNPDGSTTTTTTTTTTEAGIEIEVTEGVNTPATPTNGVPVMKFGEGKFSLSKLG